VVLKPLSKAPRKLCPASVAELLGAVSIENMEPERGGLLRALEFYLRENMKPNPSGQFTVRVQSTTPRSAKQQVAPASDEVRRAAGDFVQCAQQAKTCRKQLKSDLEPHQRVCEASRTSVQEYIQRVNPAAGVAPLQVELLGESHSFFVRAKQLRRSKPLSLKVLLEMAMEVIGHLLRRDNIPDDITDLAVDRLRAADTRARIFELLQERVAKYRSDSVRMVEKVTLERR